MTDKDVLEGKLKQAEGKVQSVAGDAADDPQTEAEGKLKQAGGKVQEEFGKAKDAVHDALAKDQV